MQSVFLSIALLFSFAQAYSFELSTSAASGLDDVVLSRMLNANNIGMYISNNGTFARNDTMHYTQCDGFFYPIDSSITLIYSAGLWLAAYVGDTARVAIVESSSEFAPGPFDHPAVEDSSIFHVYKIGCDDSLSGSEDWNTWPVLWGAPVDSSGEPLVTGEQSVWTVFNDGDSLRHTRRGGKTLPLDAEVQLYAYAYAASGRLDQVVFLDYTIINKSSCTWNDFIATILTDPDIGVYADDMGGSDSALSFAYCYTIENDGELPPGFCPAVGMMMLSAPSSESGGHPSGSTNVLRNIYRSQSVDMTLNIMCGRDPNGNDYVNPQTGLTTKYPYSGDPRSGIGWLDYGKADRKIAISSAPVDILPGDTTHLKVAVFAAWGENNFEALGTLFSLAETVYDWHTYALSGLAVEENTHDGSIQSVMFQPPEQRWCDGNDWGGSFFSGGIGWAGELWGTSLDRNENVDVEFLFMPEDSHKAYRFVEEGGAYRFADYVTVPFTCRRVSDNTALNVLFVDSDEDGKWTPAVDPAAPSEFILVTKSEYNIEPVTSYTDTRFPNDALNVDLMYAVSLLVRPRYERLNIRSGQRLVVSVEPAGDTFPADTVDFGDVIVGLDKSIPLALWNTCQFEKQYEFHIDPPEDFSISPPIVTLNRCDTVRVNVTYAPTDTAAAEAILTVVASDYNMPVRRITLKGSGQTWPLHGDILVNGILDLLDITAYIRYLYCGYIPFNSSVVLDLDNSGDVTLSDIVVLVNMIFYHR